MSKTDTTLVQRSPADSLAAAAVWLVVVLPLLLLLLLRGRGERRGLLGGSPSPIPSPSPAPLSVEYEVGSQPCQDSRQTPSSSQNATAISTVSESGRPGAVYGHSVADKALTLLDNSKWSK